MTCLVQRAGGSFGARYYNSSLSRFLTPDFSPDPGNPEPIPFADLENPQSLNLYSYVLNNPVSKTDPDGHCGLCDFLKLWIPFALAHPEAADRITQSAAGAGMMVGGVVTGLAAAGVGVAGAPETGGGSLAVTVLGAGSAAGMIAAGGVQLLAGATGKANSSTSAAEEAVQTISNPAGLIATAATGNLQDGAKMAAATDVLTAGASVKAVLSPSLVQKAAALLGDVQTAQEASKQMCKEGDTLQHKIVRQQRREAARGRQLNEQRRRWAALGTGYVIIVAYAILFGRGRLAAGPLLAAVLLAGIVFTISIEVGLRLARKKADAARSRQTGR